MSLLNVQDTLSEADLSSLLESSTYSDVSVAIHYLHSTFPVSYPREPRLILVNQLYAIVHDHTAVDVELSRRRKAGLIRMQKMTATGLDEYAFVYTTEYRDMINRIRGTMTTTTAAASIATTTTTTQTAPATDNTRRSIKRKRSSQRSRSPVTEQQQPTAAAEEDAITVDSSILPLPLSLPLSERHPNSTQQNSHAAAARSLDELHLWSVWLDVFLPNYTQLTITKEALIEYFHKPDAAPSTAYHNYTWMTDDGLISLLFHHGLLSHHTDTSYNLLIPHITHLIKEIIAARVSITRLINRQRSKEVRLCDMEERVRVQGSQHGMKWHLLEMIGGGRLLQVETTQGIVLRVPNTH